MLINNNLLDYFFSHKNTKLDLCEIVLSPNGTLTFSKYHVKLSNTYPIFDMVPIDLTNMKILREIEKEISYLDTSRPFKIAESPLT